MSDFINQEGISFQFKNLHKSQKVRTSMDFWTITCLFWERVRSRHQGVHSSWATPTGVLQLDVAASQLAKSSKPIPWFFDWFWGRCGELQFILIFTCLHNLPWLAVDQGISSGNSWMTQVERLEPVDLWVSSNSLLTSGSLTTGTQFCSVKSDFTTILHEFSK